MAKPVPQAAILEAAGLAYSAKTVNALRGCVQQVIYNTCEDCHAAGVTKPFDVCMVVQRAVDAYLNTQVTELVTLAAKAVTEFGRPTTDVAA